MSKKEKKEYVKRLKERGLNRECRRCIALGAKE